MAQTGPTTLAGKSRVRHNAITHGITSQSPVVGPEREDEWQLHRTLILESIQPENYLESTLAERAALIIWRLNRVTRYEREQISLLQERVNDDVVELLLDERENESRLQLIRNDFDRSHSWDVHGEAKAELDARYPKEQLPPIRRRPVLIERLKRERILADQPILEKIMRHEVHLNKQLFQILHELEAMQARRHGQQTLLARLDVNGEEDLSKIIDAEPARNLA